MRSITRPLDQAVNAIDAIAAGDLTQELHSARKDEFGHMLRSLSAMSTQLLREVACGDGVNGIDGLVERPGDGAHQLRRVSR